MNRSSSVSAKMNCVLCQGEGEFWLRKDERTLIRCSSCGFLWVFEGLLEGESGFSIYEDEKPIFVKDGREAYYLDDTNFRSCCEKSNWIKPYVAPGAAVLDVGANFGHFLKTIDGRYSASGLEISSFAASWGNKNFGVSIKVGSVYDIAAADNNAYDAVTCWDVIEHLVDPRAALEKMRLALTDNGLIFISTPDSGSFIARLFGSRWHYLDLIEHTAIFSRYNLKKLLGDSGFEIIGECSFGHYYRVQYIIDRLLILHRSGGVNYCAKALGLLLAPFAKRAIYIRLGDVMGIAARRIAG